jgi:hypothetical protein
LKDDWGSDLAVVVTRSEGRSPTGAKAVCCPRGEAYGARGRPLRLGLARSRLGRSDALQGLRAWVRA